jgi:hypothetical protein
MSHHTTGGLSTVEISFPNAATLNSELKKFFDTSSLKYKSYVLKGETDKLNALIGLLDMHGISYGYASGGKVSGFHYGNNASGSMDAAGALVVSTNQPKGKMVKVLFEPEAKLSTPLTYDITAWSLPYEDGLDAVANTALDSANSSKPAEEGLNTANPSAAGYISKWNSMQDARFLAARLKEDIKVRFSEKKFSIGGQDFDRGSLVITRSDNRKNPEFDAALVRIANEQNRKLFVSPTSYSYSGTDFGSPDVKMIHNQRIALLKGNYTSSLSFGAIWHFFEQQLNYPVTLIDTDYFKKVELFPYDVLNMQKGL